MAEILSPTTLVQVELFEDRAAITRRVVLPEAPGRYELVIDGLSPLLREAGLSFPDAEAPVFEDGVKTLTLRGDNITNEFKAIIERYVARTYPKKGVLA